MDHVSESQGSDKRQRLYPRGIVKEESLPYVIALGFSSGFTALYITDETVRSDMYWIVFMCPITTVSGLIGMIVPRAAIFLNAVSLAYLMFCLFVMVTLMNNLFGGRHALSEYLTEKQVVIKLSVPPVCCLKCLPTFRPTEANLKRIEWMVFQTPLIRMCLEILNMVVFLELNHRNHWWFQMSNVLGLSSMFLAFYACYVMAPLESDRLAQYRFKTIFRLVDAAQALFSLQKFCFDLLAAIGFFEEGPILPSLGKSQFITSAMLSWEMLLLSILATYYLRPSMNSVFDKYHRQRSGSPSPQSASSPNMPELPPVRPPPSKKQQDSDNLSLPANADSPVAFKKCKIVPYQEDTCV
ncbi:hypothetical protein QR680_000175 [Steinernema hermaphroditum]|uniref:Uncharacterized protein n=1 Tax=Steinernema hermaphroditum TaxID=289476 RepID=A0AA39GTV1_9BILA|nr:hypothetical protein QR680_000175 [Steinernema hermaphroditum]